MADEETKTFSQEDLGKYVAQAREEEQRKAAEQIEAFKRSTEAAISSKDEQLQRALDEQAKMSSTFDTFMQRNLEHFDDRSEEEKERDNLKSEVQRLNEQLAKQSGETKKQLDEIMAATTQINRQSGLDAQFDQGVSTFDKPDFKDALNHLYQSSVREFEFVGVKDPAQQAVAWKNQKAALVEIAAKEGKNPAEKIYEAAMLRGYKPKSAEANGNGGIDPKEELETMRKGAHAQDLTGGPTNLKELAQKLGGMSKEERDDYLDPKKNPNYKQNFEAMMSRFASSSRR